MRYDAETEATQRLYGLDQTETREFGQQCLSARWLVERGVRFVQIFHGSNGGAGAWDAHSNLQAGHAKLCQQVDKPIAGLLADLKQRGLLEETLVVWGTVVFRQLGAALSLGSVFAAAGAGQTTPEGASALPTSQQVERLLAEEPPELRKLARVAHAAAGLGGSAASARWTEGPPLGGALIELRRVDRVAAR